MAYALFAQRKIVLTGELNNAQLQQTQRSNEQYQLATQTLSLQQQLTSLNASQSNELAALYEQLANVGNDSDTETDTDSDTETDYEEERESIQAQISEKEAEFESEIDEMNREIYKVSVMENALEMEVKRLDTMVTTIEQQLEACEEAEGAGIDRATPKFNGIS